MNSTIEISENTLLWATFNRFELRLPYAAVTECSHQGACDDDVASWVDRIARPEDCTPDALRAELKEYGAWDKDELDDDAANWRRIVWLAAGNIKDLDDISTALN